MTAEKAGSIARGGAVAIGNFDGLHLGHMSLIASLTRYASRRGIPALVYTFCAHPQNVLSKSNGLKLLTSNEKKVELLSKTAVDAVYFENFTSDFAALSPEEFIGSILVGKFKIRAVAVGSGFKFGSGGSGTIETFRKYGPAGGFDVLEIPPYSTCAPPCYNGSNGVGFGAGVGVGVGVGFSACAVSSSAIRNLILRGAVDKIPPLLGRLYSIGGVAQRRADPRYGETIPSAAIRLDPAAAIPPPGAYAAYARAGAAQFRCKAAIIGRETGESEAICYFPGLCDDLHGAEIEIFFSKRIERACECDIQRFADERSSSLQCFALCNVNCDM